MTRKNVFIIMASEGCCMKWSSEADFIMPILTPKFLMEIHGHRDENDSDEFIPTSPILNR